MIFVRVINRMLLTKLPYMVFCSLLGFGVFYFMESAVFGVFFSIGIFFLIYIRLLGPMHYVTREAIRRLSEEKMLLDTNLNQFDPMLLEFKWISTDWVYGSGVIDRFSHTFASKHSRTGLYFFCQDMPYFNAFMIPWENIRNIEEGSERIRDCTKVEIENSRDIKLQNGSIITLPIASDSLNYWRAECS